MANAVCALLDYRIARGDGARTAVVAPSGSATYAELLALAARFGHAFRARGVEPEHRVAILLPDGLAWVGAFLGALRLGAVAVPLSTRLDVEGALLGHPGVADAGVVGAPAAGGLVKAFAFVVARAGAGAAIVDELRELAERELPPHQRPRDIVLVDELPRTATGKVQRFVLRERLGA